MTINTTQQALAKSYSITKGYGGMCLLFVQTCYNANAVYPSAISAWNASSRKHVTTDLNSIPVGAPIWFKPHGSPYGHVAIYAGNGNMRTTNSSTGLIHTDPIKTWQKYGYELLGYTDDIEDQKIPDLTDNKQSLHEQDGLLMGLSQYDQELVRNAVIDINNRTAEMQKTVADIDSRTTQMQKTLSRIEEKLGPVPGYPFDWLPAISNNVVKVSQQLDTLINQTKQ